MSLRVWAVVVTIAAVVGCDRDASVRDAIAGMPFRRIESRIAGDPAYRPFKLQEHGKRLSAAELRLLATAAKLGERASREQSIENVHAHAVAQLITGSAENAACLLEETIERQTDEPALLPAIRHSNDVALLTDLAAAEITVSLRNDRGEALLVAIEAAERAWTLRRSPESGWNRALAIERLGTAHRAIRAWRDYLSIETFSEWRHQAEERLQSLQRRLRAPTPDPRVLAEATTSESLLALPVQDAQQFFETELIEVAEDSARLPRLRRIGARMAELYGDRLALDTADAMSRHRSSVDGIRAYALGDFARAARALAREHNPFAYMARYQLVRGGCTAGAPACLAHIRSLVHDLESAERYPWLLARCSGMEGQALWHRGKIFDAVAASKRALREFERLHDDAGAAWTHIQLANALATAGERELSLRYQLASLRWCAVPTDDRRRQVFEGSALYFLRDDALAAAGFVIEELLGSPAAPEGSVMALALSGLLRARLRDPRAAADFRDASALLEKTAPGDRERLESFVEVLEVGSRRYAPEHSARELTAIIARYEQTPESVWLPQLLLERGEVLERGGDIRGAASDYERAMSLLEVRQPRIDRLLIGAEVTSEAETAFDRGLRLLLRQQRIGGALAIAERANALRISSVFAQSSGLRDVYRVSGQRPQVDLADVQRRLGASEQIVVYHLLHDALITWTISRTGIVGFRKALRAAELAAAVQRLRACIGGRECREGEQVRVSSALLDPWIQRAVPGATLIFVPPAQLGAIPFAFLDHDGRPILERNPIAVTTNLHAFAEAADGDVARMAAPSALFVAAATPGGELPPLPLAGREVVSVAADYADHLVIDHGTRERFLSVAARYSIIHFAGHALVDEQQPLRSALVFNDDLLYVHDLSASSFARARLVVLSACSSGREPRPTMSIATALLRQEVPSVVYTLWAVSDEVAATFSRTFHRCLALGRTRAQAVREAQLEMRQRGAPPAAWAAFQIAGATGPLAPSREGEKP